MSRLNARSEWLLRYAVGRLPYGFCTTTRLEGSPDGLDMTNVRGLQKRGWLREGENGIFYATEAGKAAVKHLDEERKEREEEKAEELAEKMMGGCGLPWCRGTTGEGKTYCPECKRQKDEERRRAERAGEQIANKGER